MARTDRRDRSSKNRDKKGGSRPPPSRDRNKFSKFNRKTNRKESHYDGRYDGKRKQSFQRKTILEKMIDQRHEGKNKVLQQVKIINKKKVLLSARRTSNHSWKKLSSGKDFISPLAKEELASTSLLARRELVSMSMGVSSGNISS